MAWYNSTGKENHSNQYLIMLNMIVVSFVVDNRTEIARTDFTIMFSEFEYNTGSICKTCYAANAKQVKAI
jgi:hypothetical protein